MLLDIVWLAPLIKIVAILSVVLLASLVAERGGPFWAGLMCGVPLASGPGYVLLALEADPGFIAASALNSVAATSAVNLFLVAVVRLAPRWPILPVLIVGIATWLIAALAIRAVAWTLASAIAVNLATLLIGCLLTRGATVETVVARVPRSRFDLPLRALAIGLLVTSVVTASHAIGPRWTGIALVFPITLVCFTLVIHGRLGGHAAAAAMASGLRAMGGFSLAMLVLHLLAPFGVALALCAALASSLCYVLAIMAWRASANSQLRNKATLRSS
jgi:hypothetical protein